MSDTNPSVHPKQRPTSAEKMADWQQKVEAFKKSGQTLAQFAREQGLKANRLGEWKRRLEQPKTQKKSSTARKSTSLAPSDTLENLPAVTANPDKGRLSVLRQTAPTGQIALQHVSGFTVRIDANTDPMLLKKVLSVLGELTTR